MRKRTIIIALAAVFILAFSVAVLVMYERTKVAMIVNDERAWDLRDASPQNKVIISEEGMVARYLTEDEDYYVGEIQDSIWMPKNHAMVETWYACDGKGVVYLKDFGTQPAFSRTDETSTIVRLLHYDEGYVPDTYRCLGFMDGWFSIDVGGSTGYIKEDEVIWDAIDSF